MWFFPLLSMTPAVVACRSILSAQMVGDVDTDLLGTNCGTEGLATSVHDVETGGRYRRKIHFKDISLRRCCFQGDSSLLVPPRGENQSVVEHGPCVFLSFVTCFRVQEDVVNPAP